MKFRLYKLILIALLILSNKLYAQNSFDSEFPSKTQAAPNFEDILDDSDFFKSSSVEKIESLWIRQLRFRWNDRNKTSFRFNQNENPRFQQISIFKKRAVEIIGYCENNKIKKIEFYIFNIGDCRAISVADYHQTIQFLVESMNEKLKVKSTEKKATSAVRLNTRIWDCKDRFWRLDSSIENNTPQIIKLTIQSKDENSGINLNKTGSLGMDKRKNVIKGEDNLVWINNIPMVDQGQKGYCVAATITRILLYYDRPADQHQVAQAANTTAERGTTSDGIATAVKAIRAKLNLKISTIYEIDDNKNERVIKAYNRIANKQKAPLFSLHGANPQILKEARCSQKGDFNNFRKKIKENIDKGIPLTWCLILGIYPENGAPPMQNGGGHMRIIIGYQFNKQDSTKDEIIFSDTWGAGHEKKKMLLSDAFAATQMLYIIQP